MFNWILLPNTELKKKDKGEKIVKQDYFFNLLIILYWIKVR